MNRIANLDLSNYEVIKPYVEPSGILIKKGWKMLVDSDPTSDELIISLRTKAGRGITTIYIGYRMLQSLLQNNFIKILDGYSKSDY